MHNIARMSTDLAHCFSKFGIIEILERDSFVQSHKFILSRNCQSGKNGKTGDVRQNRIDPLCRKQPTEQRDLGQKCCDRSTRACKVTDLVHHIGNQRQYNDR